MRICLISPLPLLPNSSGATARMVSMVNFLASKGHELSIVLPYIYQGTEPDYLSLRTSNKIRLFKLFSSAVPLSSQEDASIWSFLKKVRDLLPFNVTIFSPAKLARLYIEAKAIKPDIILAEFDGSWLVGYTLSRLLKSPLIVDKHNIESILYYRMLKQAKCRLTLWERFKVRTVLMIEKIVWRTSDGIVTVSDHDLSVAQRLFGFKKHVAVAPNGVEIDEKNRCQNKTEIQRLLHIPFNGKMLIFHGLGTYPPNIDARERILNSILPSTRELLNNDVYAVIVGPGNAPNGKMQMYDNVRLVGELSKKQLFQIIQCSDVAVVPLKSGSGTRIKILDYFSMNVPVVATSLAAEGLPTEDGRDILIRDDDKGIVEAVIRVLSDGHLRESLTQNAKRLVEREFDWKTALEPVERLIWQLGAKDATQNSTLSLSATKTGSA